MIRARSRRKCLRNAGIILMSVMMLVNTNSVYAASDLEVTSDIVIDGYFEDWADIPHTELIYSDKDKASSGAVYMGDDRLYVHYKRSYLYTDSLMRVDYIEFKVNDQEFKMEVLPVDDSGNYLSVPDTLDVGLYTNYDVFLRDVQGNEYDRKSVDGQVAFRIYVERWGTKEEGEGDEIEFSISYDKLEELTGIKQSEIRKVELYNPHLGAETITNVGTSSGPWFGIGISIVAAVGLYYALVRRKKREEEII